MRTLISVKKQKKKKKYTKKNKKKRKKRKRIYGTSWSSQKELDEYLKRIEEASKTLVDRLSVHDKKDALDKMLAH